MKSIAARWHRSSRRLSAVALAAALGAAALAPAASSADSLTDSLYGPSMKLKFAAPNARLAGPGAIVVVRCVGPRDGTCVGTASLRVGGAKHPVAFSVPGGKRRRLVVPLDLDGRRLDRKRVRAVARTVQPLGSCRESRRLLRLR